MSAPTDNTQPHQDKQQTQEQSPEAGDLATYLLTMKDKNQTVVFDGGLANQCAKVLAEQLADDDMALGLESYAAETQQQDLQQAVGAWQAMQHVYGTQVADQGMALFYATGGTSSGASDFIRFKAALDGMVPHQTSASALYVQGELNTWSQSMVQAASDYGVQVFRDTQDWLNHFHQKQLEQV